MSDEFVTPQPENGETNGFDFSALSADQVPTEEMPPSFEPPRKPRWWERKLKNGSEPRKPKVRKPAPSMPRGGLRKPLEDLYTGLGMMLMPFDPSCAKVIIEAAPKCAESLDDLAKTNPAVRRILISLVTTSAWGSVIMAHAPIIMAVAMHHVPALKERQEKMVGEFAEMLANMPSSTDGDE